MSNILEYTLSLKDLISTKLQKIGINNDMMLEKFSKLEKTQQKVSEGFGKMGRSVHTLQQKIELLKAERDLLPVGSLSIIRKYNSEIHKLERSVSKLQTLNGSKLKTWFSDAFNSLPGIATNPLVLLGGGIAKSIKNGMESDLQKANILTLLKGDAEKAKTIFADISDYGVQTPYDKTGLIEAQKTMMSFGLNADFAFEKLKNIGDIALGDAQKMQSLALAFAQASSAGKLQGQDLLQMINAGFNPLQVISERTGESMASLKERMSKGGVSAKELAQAFEWATDKQGQFYQGAEKAGQTLAGRWGKMLDSLTELSLKVYDMISPIVVPLIDLFTFLFEKIGNSFGWLIDKFKEGNPYVIGITTAIGAFTTALILHNTYTALATLFQNKLTWAVFKTNLAFLSNPITWVIFGIIALISIIAYAVYGITGWGKAWEHTVQGVKHLWNGYIAYVKMGWNTLIQGLMIGLNKIKEGWYKFKNAVGLGDEGENNAMLAKIQADTEARKKSIVESINEVAESGKKAKESFGKAWDAIEFKSFKEIKDGVANKLGMGASVGAGGNAITPANNRGGITGKGTGKNKTDNILSGGAKQTHITINIDKVGTDTKIYVASKEEGLSAFGEKIREELLRAINSINQLQTG